MQVGTSKKYIIYSESCLAQVKDGKCFKFFIL